MRAGDELSETNKKLRGAVYAFIEWIYQALGGYGAPGEESGWIFRKDKEGNRQTSVSFKRDIGGWYSVTINDKEPYMGSIILLCQALAGPEGERLLAWLEKETQERSQLLVALQSRIKAAHSSIAGQGS